MSVGASMRRAASGLSTAAPFDPLSIGWYAAFWSEDPDWANPGDGNPVASWRNAGSGDWGDAVEATAANQPLYHASDAFFNNRPIVQGDVTDDLLTTGLGTLVSQPNTWVVLGAASDNNNQHLMDGQTSGRRTTGYSWQNINWFAGSNRATSIDLGDDGTTPHLVLIEANGASSALEIDGAVRDAGNIGTNGLDGLVLFANISGGGPGGKIALAGVVNGLLTSQQKSDLVAWSQSRYGTP